MVREATITQEQVNAAAAAMQAAGTNPTIRAMREALGGKGSNDTIIRFLSVWKDENAAPVGATDDTVDAQVIRAINLQTATRVQAATETLRAQVLELKEQQGILLSDAEQAATDLDATATQLAEATATAQAMAGQIEQLKITAVENQDRATAAIAAATAAAEQERTAAELARVNLAKAELRLEAVPRIETEIAVVRAELVAERAESAKQHELAAVATAKHEAAENAVIAAERTAIEAIKRAQAAEQSLTTERMTVHATTARLEAAAREITAAQEAATAAERTASEAIKRAQAVEQSLVNERMTVHATTARLEAAAREITTAQEAASAARATAKKSGEDAAELRGKVAAMIAAKTEPAKKKTPAAKAKTAQD